METDGQTTVNTIAYTYDAAGQTLTQTVNGQVTSFEYDAMGRQTKVTAPGGVETDYEYYPTGALKKVSGAEYPVEYTYDAQGRRTAMQTWQSANVTATTGWTYNVRGFLTAKTYADSQAVTYTYDADGRLLTRTWARLFNNQPLVTTYSYDAAGRATGYSYSDGTTPAVSLTLNYLDQTAAVADAAGTRNFTYNANHALANESIPYIVNTTLGNTYDTYGRRTGMTLGDGNTTFAQAAYTYDVQSRVATVGNVVDTLTYTYRPGLNQVAGTAWTNAAALPAAYTYDQYHRLTDIAVNNSPVYGYTLNAKNQRIAGLLGNGDHWAYGYDGLGQLATAVKQDGNDNPLHSMSYLYDQIGNRTSAIEDAATTGYTANLVNQYTLVNAAVPTYDADGNMLTHGDWTYTYNAENRLVKAESDDVKVECDYDYMGRRIWKKVYDKGLLGLDWSLDQHRKFVYDGYKLIAEFDALNSDALLANYLWQPVGLDVPLMRTANSVNEYVIADGNKNVIELRDITGVVTDAYTYAPFGGVTHAGSSDNPFQFSSEYHDSETGLVYYNYRYYSPTLGRWINRDPIEEQGGVNLYGMVRNNPVSRVDYLGTTTLGTKITMICLQRIMALFEKNGIYNNQASYSTPFPLEDEQNELQATIFDLRTISIT